MQSNCGRLSQDLGFLAFLPAPCPLITQGRQHGYYQCIPHSSLPWRKYNPGAIRESQTSLDTKAKKISFIHPWPFVPKHRISLVYTPPLILAQHTNFTQLITPANLVSFFIPKCFSHMISARTNDQVNKAVLSLWLYQQAYLKENQQWRDYLHMNKPKGDTGFVRRGSNMVKWKYEEDRRPYGLWMLRPQEKSW